MPIRPLSAEDLVSVVDVLAELLPEFDGAAIVRPWALSAAAAAEEGSIAGVDVHAGLEDRLRAMAETLRRLKPLDRGNDAFAVTAVMVRGRLAGTHMSFDRAAAIAGVRHPAH
ncbi:hypothetical protein ACFWGD_10260 [Corynebacterium sp. NPDC060344]|uniref:hypothetical protein n=1 Tax=Corynebacterium sp. NPDC060344 TaxID=3347101 RepID=UPI003660BA7B